MSANPLDLTALLRDGTTAPIVDKWCSGDFVYGAIRTGFAPSGTAHKFVNGREYPVAQLRPSGDGYLLIAWVNRHQPFPEPLPFNRA